MVKSVALLMIGLLIASAIMVLIGVLTDNPTISFSGNAVGMIPCCFGSLVLVIIGLSSNIKFF